MNSTERVAEIQHFLEFIMMRWPQNREAVAARLAPRCRRCILSERYAPLVDGLCPACWQEEAGDDGGSGVAAGASGAVGEAGTPRAGAAEALRDLLREYEGAASADSPAPASAAASREYDALLLFSGGKDSAFLLHRLRAEHPRLRLLAVTVDNGFFSSVAMANARRIVGRIGGVDHMVYRPRSELFVKTFRHAFTHLNEGGCYTTVDRMDGDLVFDIGRNLAAMLGVPLMIAGLSSEQVRRVLGLDHFESPRSRELARRETSAGFDLQSLYTPEEQRYWWDGRRWGEGRVPRVVYPFFAWDYDEAAVREMVVELGLIEPGADNPLITNNDTIPVMVAVDIAKMGYCGFEPEFAELVRQGKADRATWLAVFEAAEALVGEGRFLPHCIADTLTRLDLTEADVGIPKLQLNG